MVSDTADKSSKNAGHYLTEAFSSKNEQTPNGYAGPIQIVNSGSVVSNGTVVVGKGADAGAKAANGDQDKSAPMNRAKSQEITKSGAGEVADPLADDQQEVKLGQCPPSKIVKFDNNKQEFYDSKSKNVPKWYNRTAPGQYESIDLSRLSSRETGTAAKINPLMIYTYGLATKKLGNLSASNRHSTAQMTHNVFTRQLPRHRFTDYSKAQLNNHLLERRNDRDGGKYKTDEDVQVEIVIGQVGNLRDEGRLEYLYPPEKLMRPAAKHIGFTK